MLPQIPEADGVFSSECLFVVFFSAVNEATRVVDRNFCWSLVPALTSAGFASAIFSLYIWFPTGRLFVLLSSLSLALALGAVLWFTVLIHTWRTLAILAGVTITVHLLALYEELHLPQRPNEYVEVYVDIFRLGSIRPQIAMTSLAVAFVVCVAFLLFTTPRCKIGWAVAIAIACASLNAVIVTAVDGAQRGAWISFFTGSPSAPSALWQPSLAFFLAVALALKGLIPAFRVGAQDRPSPSSRSRFIGFGILLVFWIITGTWVFALDVREGRRIRELQARQKAETMKSLAEAPPFENLPASAPKPLDQVFLMQEIYGFKPNFSNSHDYPAQHSQGEMYAPFPERRTYSAMYGGGTTYGGVTVNVTEYPNTAWAKYEVRNTPTEHEFTDHTNFKHLTRFGNNLFQYGPMNFIWASDNKVIFLYCEGVMPEVIDEFLKAYLAKYPSSL